MGHARNLGHCEVCYVTGCTPEKHFSPEGFEICNLVNCTPTQHRSKNCPKDADACARADNLNKCGAEHSANSCFFICTRKKGHPHNSKEKHHSHNVYGHCHAVW